MSDSVTVNVVENITEIDLKDNTPSKITVVDNNTSEITIIKQVTDVTVQGTSPSITVEVGGTRGPIYAPGMDFGQNELLAYMVGAVERSHLAVELSTEIDESTTGLAEARESLEALIDITDTTNTALDTTNTSLSQTQEEIVQLATRVTSNEAGEIEAIQTQFTQTAEDFTLVSARFDVAEDLLTSAQLQIDDQAVRLTVAEENAGVLVVSQEELLSNQWTVKINETTVDDEVYSTGIGLVLYPDWVEGKYCELDETFWFEDETYKVLETHTATATNSPTYEPDLWEYVPGGVKSQVGFDAEQFFIRTTVDGMKYTPFIVQEDTIYINGDLISNGSITADMMAANQIITWSLQSADYDPSATGFLLDATTGEVEFNNLSVDINSSSGSGIITRNLDTLDYAHLYAGDLNFYCWNGSNHEIYKSVSHIETGIADNSTVTYIPGLYKSTPQIMVSPASIQTVKGSISGTDQSINCIATDIIEYSSRKWKFTPVATLTNSSTYVSIPLDSTIDVTAVHTTQTTYSGPVTWTCSTILYMAGQVASFQTDFSYSGTFVAPITSSDDSADFNVGLRVYVELVKTDGTGATLIAQHDVYLGWLPSDTSKSGSFSINQSITVPYDGMQVQITYGPTSYSDGSYVYIYSNHKNSSCTLSGSLQTGVNSGEQLATGNLNWIAIGD